MSVKAVRKQIAEGEMGRQGEGKKTASFSSKFVAPPSRDVWELMNQAQSTGSLYLSMRGLEEIPSAIFELKNLRILDLGFNDIKSIPSSIKELKQLEQLWLNDNPLQELPTQLAECRALLFLDLRNTDIKTLPAELGRLKAQNLVAIDVRSTQLDSEVFEHVKATDHRPDAIEEVSLLNYLAELDGRLQLRLQLIHGLCDEVYRDIAATEPGRTEVEDLADRVLRLFNDQEEVKSIIRNISRLFSSSLSPSQLSEESVRERFVSLRRDIERQQLAAELELKIRAVYYDRIEPSTVPDMVMSIYQHMHKLEDVKFLIRHAADLFPETPQEVEGKLILERVQALQEKLARERRAAIEQVRKAASSLYSDVNPQDILKAVETICSYFKSTEDIKSLAADAASFFPTEFTAIKPQAMRSRFVQKKQQLLT